MTAPPILRKRPLDRNHLEPPEWMPGLAMTLFAGEVTEFIVSLQTVQFLQQIIFLGLSGESCADCALLDDLVVVSTDSISRKATSASKDLIEIEETITKDQIKHSITGDEICYLFVMIQRGKKTKENLCFRKTFVPA